MKRQKLFYLLLASVAVMPIGAFVGMKFVHRCIGQDIVRRVSGLPSGYRLWAVIPCKNHLFVVDAGQMDTKQWETIRSTTIPPFRAFRVDPVTEQVVEETDTQAMSSIILSEYPWLLSQGYEVCLIDKKTNTAYALGKRWIKTRLSSYPEVVYPQVEVIDLSTRQVKKIIRLLPEAVFGTFALHPNKAKLYLSVQAEDVGGALWVYSTITLERTKVIELGGSDHPIRGIRFSKDGRYLFGSLSVRGIAIIDTEEDKLIGWINPLEYRNYTTSIELSSDGREIYVGLEYDYKKGGIAAIDVEQRKIVRILELSPTGCVSVAKVGEKLFAACLDGVYVIDIPAWRKQQ